MTAFSRSPTVALDRDDPRPIYTQIIDEIRREISAGTLRENDALPSVRTLAGTLAVNPNTVKQAYRDLVRRGIAFARRGAGTFVSPHRKPVAERAAIARDVARRSLRDAKRHGLSPDELIAAVRALDASAPQF